MNVGSGKAATGSVTISDQQGTLGTVQLSNGSFSGNTQALTTPGTYTFKAHYSGDSTYPPLDAQPVTAALGMFTVLRELGGPDCASALEVLFSRSEPSDLAPYQQAFGVKLSFNAGQTAILLPHYLLDQRVHGTNDALRTNLEMRARSLWPTGELDIVTHIRRELRVGLLTRDVSAPAIATRLDMSPRTLNRRLDAWGLSFHKMVDESRCEFAQQLLATQLSIAKIATIVGYNAPGVLTRAFTRWVGVTPSEWRSGLGAPDFERGTKPSSSTVNSS